MLSTLIEIWNKILLSNLFNFVLMLVLLGWIIKKFNIADALEAGRKSIEEKILNSKEEHQKALQTLYDTQEKGIEVDKEILEIIDKSAKNAVLVGEKLVDDAQKLAETFSVSTQKAINTNTEKLRLNLTNETAQTVLNMAKNHIEKQLKEDRNLHIRYINESIDSLKGVDLG